MEEILKILTLDGNAVSPVGMLLAAGIALWRGWLVLGPTHNASVAECAKLKDALTAATQELKTVETDYVEARIELARLTERLGMDMTKEGVMGRNLMLWLRQAFGMEPIKDEESDAIIKDTKEAVKGVQEQREGLAKELAQHRGIDLAHTLLLARDRELERERLR
jgi:hypothetical protein